jgi:tetratricopeptide (TPR) repeat protein
MRKQMVTHLVGVLVIGLSAFSCAAGPGGATQESGRNIAATKSAATATAPATRTAAATRAAATRSGRPRPATRLLTTAEAKQLRVAMLMRQSLELFRQKKFDQVEKVLAEALALEPENPTNLYNMACVKAVIGQSDAALDYLEKAAEAGFTDFRHIARDQDLVSLRELARYRGLLGRKDEIQRRVADRAVAAFRKRFGEKYLYEVDAQSKLIFATNTDQETLEVLKKRLLAQAHAMWEQALDHKPDYYITVVLPSLEDYRKMAAPGVAGFYNHGGRILISQSMGRVMAHEFTHALHHGDSSALGQAHPIWLIEGLAVLYESAAFEGQRLVPRDNFRLAPLQAASKRKALIPLENLLKMDQRAFLGQAMLAYGQSGSLLQYLHEKDLLRPFYIRYKADYEKDRSGRLAMEAVTGMKLPELEQAWNKWMVARTPPPSSTGPDGVYLGLRFGQGNDGLRVDEVVAGGAGDKAGVEVGDVVVGVNEEEVRDSSQLMPLLQKHKPGDKITLRVRREDEYLEVPVVLGKRPATTTAATTKPATRPVPAGRRRSGEL